MFAKKEYLHQRWILGLIAFLTVGCSKPIAAPNSENRTNKVRASEESDLPKAGGRLFQASEAKRFSLQFVESDSDLLQQEHRPYIRADFSDGDSCLKSVGIKLKGAAGSYQLLDGKPGFTVKFDKFRKKQNLDQLEKIHLNNSVQDGTYLCEWIGSEVFRLAGYPSPRVSHALLRWNQTDEALYVVREAYDKTFLRRFFSKVDGNLYDGGFLQDLDANLEKDSGMGTDDRSDLRSIVKALENNEAAKRYRETEKLIDVERFLTVMALERMLCHWDGYSMNANNYRLYFDPDTQRAIFLPHGMDQLFGDPNMPLFDFPAPRVSSQIMGSDAWRARYRKKVNELLPIFDPPQNLIDRLDETAVALRPTIQKLGDEPLQEFEARLSELKQRINERAVSIKEQLAQDEPQPLNLAISETYPLNDWYPACDQEPMATRPPVDQAVDHADDYLQLSLSTEPGYASWRHGLLLKRGTYRIEGRYRTGGLQPIDDLSAESVVLGTSRNEQWQAPASGDDWQNFSTTISVVEDRFFWEVVLGIRAKHGWMKIDLPSFRVLRTH